MIFFIWLVLFLVIASFLLLIPASWRHAIYERYSGSRPVACPENQQPAVVDIDIQRAAETVMDGHPDLRLRDCTRWPERAKCNQACLSQAIQAEPYKPGEVEAGRKQIYHLPILLASFIAWYLGALWHSPFMFRAEWLSAIGFDHAETRLIVGWYLVLSLAVCFLFAYGVAWLLAVTHRKGVLHGVLMSALLGGAVIAASWYGIAKLPHDLFVIEASYTALAIVVMGAIVGGLYDKLVLHPQGADAQLIHPGKS
jgi:Protein of unknown function (DUF1761)